MSGCGVHFSYPYGPKPRHRLWIRTQTGACDGCPVRTTCRTTDRPNIPKQLARDIKSAVRVRRTIDGTGRAQRQSDAASISREIGDLPKRIGEADVRMSGHA